MTCFAELPEADARRFESHKEVMGYCYTTNILAGEYYERHGLRESALKEYLEITDREPENPWGWFLAGECLQQAGDAAAIACYRRVLELVPRHAPSLRALTQKKRGC